MKKRIFIGLILISLLTGLMFTLVVGGVLPKAAQRRVIDGLQREAVLIRARAPEEGLDEDFLGRLMTVNRITWVAADGHVRYDHPTDVQTTENHADPSTSSTTTRAALPGAAASSASISACRAIPDESCCDVLMRPATRGNSNAPTIAPAP